MAQLPRPIRRLIRRFRGEKKPPGTGVNPQTVGLHSRGTMLYLPTPMMIALILFAAAVAAGQLIQAMRAGDSRTQIAVPGQIGALHSVFMIGGQVFIGSLESVDHGSVVLNDVFYFQAQGAGAPATGTQQPPARGAQLVRRVDSDWHQPTQMSIPIDKILMIENVGRDSLVARLIAEGRARQPGAAAPQ